MNVVTTVILITFVWLNQLCSNNNYRAFALINVNEGNGTDPISYYMVHIFNDLRQHVSPPSSNMMLLQIDDMLIDHASINASECTLQHTTPTMIEIDGFPAFAVLVSLEVELTDYITEFLAAEFASCNDSQCDDVYLNLIWYDLKYIGCAVENCTDNQLLVCVFGDRFKPDYVDTLAEAYTIGYPCSNCSGEFPACHAEFSLCMSSTPAALIILQQPGPNVTKAGVPLYPYFKIGVTDQNSEPYIGKYGPACYFEIVVEFAMKSHHEARLRGSHAAPLEDGVAIFDDLAISEHGEYKLRFYLVSPHNPNFSLIVESDLIHIDFPPHELDMCEVTEGDPQFEVHYDWTTSNCTGVCLEDCQGQQAKCFEFEDCGPNAYCEDCACVCKTFKELEIFKFDPHHLANLIRPQTICESDRIVIRLDKCGLNAIGFTLKDLYTLGPKIDPIDIDYLEDINEQLRSYIQTCTYNDCRGYVTVGTHGLQYEFGVYGNFEDCNAGVQENDTHVTYTHMVRGYGGFSSALVTRKKPIAIQFSCTYIKHVSLLDFGVHAFLGLAGISIANHGHFDVSIGVWTDGTYSERYTAPPDIMVDDDVFVGVHLEGIDPTTAVLYADHCFATPSDNPNDATSFDMITDGCADGNDTTIVQNGEDKDVLFSFASFTFGSQPNGTLYIHCDVIVCVTDHAPCTPQCNSRRKRAAAATNRNSQTVSIGPLNIRKDKGITGNRGASGTSGSSNGFLNQLLRGISGTSGVEIFV